MPTLKDQIQAAEKAVQNGRRIVALQRARVRNAGDESLLYTFEQTLKILEAELDELLAERISN